MVTAVARPHKSEPVFRFNFYLMLTSKWTAINLSQDVSNENKQIIRTLQQDASNVKMFIFRLIFLMLQNIH